jgi:hypothetical protein
MNARHRIACVFGGALALACTQVIAQDATGSFRQELDVATPLELDVATGSGGITVRNGAQNRAIVIGRITVRDGRGRSAEEAEEIVRRLEAEPPVELTGNQLRVGHIQDEDFRRNVSIGYEIEVPAQTRVMARSGSGGQAISGVAGPVNVTTGSGGLTLADLGGGVEARTGSGSIRAERIAGGFRGDTGSGSVRVTQTAPGDVAVSTGSGGADISGVDGALRVRTGSGGVTVEGTPRGTWDIQTGSGSVAVRVPQNAAFNLDAHAGSGGVSTDHPVTMQGSLARGSMSGPVRGGGPLVRARTGSGGIRIE